jgi:hypothetical protein
MTRTPLKLILSTLLMLLAAVAASPATAATNQQKFKLSIVSVSQTSSGEGEDTRWRVTTTLQWPAVEGADYYEVCAGYNQTRRTEDTRCYYPDPDATKTTFTAVNDAYPGTRINYWVRACDTDTTPTVCRESNIVSVTAGKTK